MSDLFKNYASDLIIAVEFSFLLRVADLSWLKQIPEIVSVSKSSNVMYRF